MRAAKERKRLERLALPDVLPDSSRCHLPKSKPSGFEVTIRCLDDGERVTLRTFRAPWGGLTVSPTLAGRKVAAVLAHYHSAPRPCLNRARCAAVLTLLPW